MLPTNRNRSVSTVRMPFGTEAKGAPGEKKIRLAAPGTPKEKEGDKLVMSIKEDADGSYSGTAFDPQRDLSYKLTVKVEGDRMTTKGCVIAGLICKGVDWTRIN